MKNYLFVISLFLIGGSWSLGIYFTTLFYTPTIIIPFFDQYLWMSEFKGFLGLTLIFSLVTIPLLLFIFKNRSRLSQKKWYSMMIANQLIWFITIGVQVKMMAYNLGICH